MMFEKVSLFKRGAPGNCPPGGTGIRVDPFSFHYADTVGPDGLTSICIHPSVSNALHPPHGGCNAAVGLTLPLHRLPPPPPAPPKARIHMIRKRGLLRHLPLEHHVIVKHTQRRLWMKQSTAFLPPKRTRKGKSGAGHRYNDPKRWPCRSVLAGQRVPTAGARSSLILGPRATPPSPSPLRTALVRRTPTHSPRSSLPHDLHHRHESLNFTTRAQAPQCSFCLGMGQPRLPSPFGHTGCPLGALNPLPKATHWGPQAHVRTSTADIGVAHRSD